MLKDILLPDLEGATDVTLGAWLKRPGEGVEEGEVIAEAATDKVNAEVVSPFSGTVAELLVEEGEQLKVGQAIARVTVAG